MSELEVLEAVQWIQRTYGGIKIGKAFGHRDQWIICSFAESGDVLCIGFCQGRNEGRIKGPRGFLRKIFIGDIPDLETFKHRFTKLISNE